MDEQIGESKEEEVDESNWYRNEVEGVDSRDKVKHDERSDQLLLGW